MLKTVQIENYRNVQTCTGFASVVKNLPATQEMRAQSLGREDPLEKKNGNLLQYSCLENTVHGVAESDKTK